MCVCVRVCVCGCVVVCVCVCVCLVGAAGEEDATLIVLRNFRIGSKLLIRLVCHHKWEDACASVWEDACASVC